MSSCVRSAALALAGSLLAAACASRPSAPAAAAPASAHLVGKFVWHDLVTDDPAASRRFYVELLGWQFTDTTRRGRPYAIAWHQGRRVGGLVAVEPAAAGQEVSQWIGYQSVASVDDAVATVQKAGGRTLVAPVNLTAGRAAVVSDPEGAPLGLVRLTAGDPADEPSPREGTFFWMEYLARDPAAAATFYADTFGYERSVTDRLGAPDYVVLSRGRARGGVLRRPRPELRPIWLPYVLVADPAAMAARALSLGGTVLLEPRAEIRNGSLAVVADPSGAVVALQKYPFQDTAGAR